MTKKKSMLLEIICDCPIQNKRFGKQLRECIDAMYGLENRCTDLKYYRQYIREYIDGHTWFKYFFYR